MLSMLSLLLCSVVPRSPVIIQEVFASSSLSILLCKPPIAVATLSNFRFFFLYAIVVYALALSLLVSGIRLADNVQVAIMSLAGLASNNLRAPDPLAPAPRPFPIVPRISHTYLAVLATLFDRAVHLHAANLLLRRGCRGGQGPRKRRQDGRRRRGEEGARGERTRRERQRSENGRHCGFVRVVVFFRCRRFRSKQTSQNSSFLRLVLPLRRKSCGTARDHASACT